MLNPIRALKAQVQDQPHNTALHYLGNAVSFAQLDGFVQRIANRLRAEHVRPGDVVVVVVSNTVMHWAVTLAAFHEACISCSAPNAHSVPPGVLVDFYIVDEGCETRPNGRRGTIVADKVWIEAVHREGTGISATDYATPDEVCRLVLSSGTTGDPKAIALSVRGLEERCRTRNAIDAQQACELTLFNCCSSIGLYVSWKALMNGLPLIMNFGFDQVHTDVNSLAVTNLSGSPAQLQDLVDAFGQLPPLKRQVDSVTTSGSRVSARLLKQLNSLLGPNVVSIYGATEVGPVATGRAEALIAEENLAGFVLPFAEVDVVDEQDRSLPRGAQGRIRIRTPNMASGYYSTDSGADESFKAGWFYPGDLGWLRDDGGLVLRGRTADLLNIGGLKLNPNVIDRYLVSIDGVRDALSFEYEDAMGATRIGAAVVVEGSFDARLLPNLIAHDLDADYRPTKVVVVDRLARNQAGKALRIETRILALGR